MLNFIFIIFLFATVGAAPLLRENGGNKANHNSYPQGYHRVGDMILPNGFIIHGNSSRNVRNAIPHNQFRWPTGRVPYKIDQTLQHANHKIGLAFEEYHSKTRIRFVPWSNERNYIYLFSGNGCYSNVGMINQRQYVSLGPGCLSHGRIVHELGHVVGFFHEETRSDRDKYVTINWENVKPGMKDQFLKLRPSENLLLSPFDVQSIMMDGPSAYSKDGAGPTIVSKMGVKWDSVSCKRGLAQSDVIRINKLYS